MNLLILFALCDVLICFIQVGGNSVDFCFIGFQGSNLGFDIFLELTYVSFSLVLDLTNLGFDLLGLYLSNLRFGIVGLQVSNLSFQIFLNLTYFSFGLVFDLTNLGLDLIDSTYFLDGFFVLLSNLFHDIRGCWDKRLLDAGFV